MNDELISDPAGFLIPHQACPPSSLDLARVSCLVLRTYIFQRLVAVLSPLDSLTH